MRGVWALAVALGLAWGQGGDYAARCARLYAQGALEAAQATCELGLVVAPQDREVLRLLVRIHLDKGEVAQAQVYLDRLGEDPEAPYLRARALLAEGRYREVLAMGLEGTEGRLLRALALERLGRLEEALALARGLSLDREVRLLLGRLYLELGRPLEGVAYLGDTPEEAVLKGRLLLAGGRLAEAASLLEEVRSRLSPESPLYREALAALALARFGRLDGQGGFSALGELAQVENLPGLWLARLWPWLLCAVAFLGLLVYGESRIEPLRTVEVVEDPLPGPGRLYLFALGGLGVALLVSVATGLGLYGNALALFTPYQQGVVLPLFHLAYGLYLFLGLYLWQRRRFPGLLGPKEAWVEGFWVGPLLLGLLWAYGQVRGFLGLGGLPPSLLTFLGLALAEPFFRGLAPWVFRERYRDLALPLAALLFAVAWPGPALFLLLVGWLLLRLKERTGGLLGLALGWVVAGVVMGLFPSAWLRRF